MANQFLNNQVYANVMLLLLKNQLVMGRMVDGQFKDQVTDENGLIINVKRPPRFARNDSSLNDASLAAQDVLTGSIPIAVNQYGKVHISIGDIEYVTSYNALMQNETMKSAASTLAHQVDNFLINKLTGFHSWIQGVGTVATPGIGVNVPTTATDKNLGSPVQAAAGYQRLLDMGAPVNDLYGVVTPADGVLLRASQLTAFTPNINETALEKAKLPMYGTIDWYETQQCPTLTTGSRVAGATSLVNGAAQNVNYRDVKGSAQTAGFTQTLNLKSDAAGATIKKGDVLTIAGVFAWDWRNQQALTDLAQFTVTADATYLAGTPTTVAVTITPPIIVQGTNDGVSTSANTAFGTASAAPADGAAVSFAGAASTNFRVRAAFHKTAIAMVSTRLQMPFTGVASFATDPDTGIAIRYWRGSDISTGAHVHRWDMMFGASVTNGYLGARLVGS